MKKIVTVCSTLVVFCALFFATLHIIFLNSHHQAYHKGALIGSDSFTHTFRIVNYSWRMLEVGDVSSSCGCTVVADLPKTIPPFRTLYVPVNITLTGRSGSFTSNVKVDLKDYGVAEFKLTADIYPMMPPVIELGNVEKGAPIEKMFAAPQAMVDNQFAGFSDAVTVSVETIEGQPTIKLTANAPEAGGDFEIPVMKEDGTPVLKGYVLRVVEPVFSNLSMGYLRPGDGAESTATKVAQFSSPYGTNFTWRRDLTEHSDLIAIEETEVDVGMAVSIRLKASSSNGVYREVVDFQFEVEGSSDMVQVPVEVYAYVLSEPG